MCVRKWPSCLLMESNVVSNLERNWVPIFFILYILLIPKEDCFKVVAIYLQIANLFNIPLLSLKAIEVMGEN